jgi:solute carrier family 6 amino acid transporter-like protein 5/7/9/14
VLQQQNNSFSKYHSIHNDEDINIFFSKLLLGKSERFEDFGTPQLFPALSLLLAWIIVGACIIRGVKSSGKVCFIYSSIYLNLNNI